MTPNFLKSLDADDIFISYSREDGSAYLTGLDAALSARGFSCFTDKRGTDANPLPPKTLFAKIRACKTLVLLATPAALRRPEHIAPEISEFAEANGTSRIICVSFDRDAEFGDWTKTPWYAHVQGKAREREDPSALKTGEPSPGVVETVAAASDYMKSKDRVRKYRNRALWVLGWLVVAIIAAGVFAGFMVKRAAAAAKEAREQSDKATAATRLAAEKTKEAERATILAAEKTGEAERATKLAEEKTKEAEDATKLAREKTRDAELAQAEAVKAEGRRRVAEGRAREQERIADSREGAATALSRLAFDPEDSLKVSSKAYASWPTTQAADALRKSLFDSHIQSVLRGHTDAVWDATFDAAGRLALTAGGDGTVRVWEPRTGREVTKLSGAAAGDLLQVGISPDGEYVAAPAPRQGGVLLWKLNDAASADKPRLLRGVARPAGPEVRCSDSCAMQTVAFSPDSKHVAAGGQDGVVWVWETATGVAQNFMDDHRNAVNQITFSPDGRHVLSAGADDQALLWEWRAERSGRNPRALAHEGPVVSAHFSVDGAHVLTAWNKPIQSATFARTEQGEAWVWKTETLERAARLAGHVGSLTGARFSPDGEFVVTASDDATARVWRWKSDAVRDFPMILRGHTADVTAAEFSPDSRYVVTSSLDGTARVWKPETKRGHAEETRKSLDVPPLATLRGHGGDLRKAAYSPDGRYIVTASEDQTGRVWRAQVEQVVAALPEHRIMVESAVFSPDGRYVATTAEGYQPVRVWDWRDAGRREPVAELRLPQGAKFRLPVFSPDGRFVAAVLDAVDGERVFRNSVAVWEWQREEGRRSPLLINGHQNKISSVAFSHDAAGRYILTAAGGGGFAPDGTPFPDDNTVRVWDWMTEEGRQNPVVLGGYKYRVGQAVFSSDDRYVVSASSDGVRVFDRRRPAGKDNPVLLTSVTNNGFSGVAISRDGEYVAAAGGGRDVAVVWRWGDERARKTPTVLRGHAGQISTVAFSPNGALVLTSSADGTERLWDARTGLPVSVLSGHEKGESFASFSRDGTLIVAADGRTARVYSCDKCAPPEDLMALVPGHVSPQNFDPTAAAAREARPPER